MKERCLICSILGFTAHGSASMDMGIVETMIRANISRGPHAYGFAWIDCRGRLRCYKQPGRLTENMHMLNLMRDARSMILHLRYATHGKPSENVNNHPHACDGGWIVHNGWLRDYQEILVRKDLWPVSECDSEVIALLIEESKKKSFDGRISDAMSEIDPGGPIAFLGLWRRKFVAVRRNSSPLHMAKHGSCIYFSSIGQGLPENVYSFSEGQRLVIELEKDGSIAVAGKVGELAEYA